MFGSLKNIGALTSLLGKREQIAKSVEKVLATLDQRRITVNAPDGSVTVVANGKSQVVSVSLAPAALAAAGSDEQARAALERTIAGAMAAAQVRAMEIARQEAQKEADALGVPELLSSIPGLIKK
ncbi:MAG: hypothetical protein C0475_03925 [Planctomyces sp.]|nr:hypothetical protein [Planctomyces sp.]MBA4039416.1 hypothetical protein [Planctomyces sp.]MBA4120352.1 hypothetical protein [Isosphaera sp.]